MSVLIIGVVMHGYSMAGGNYAPLLPLIEQRSGLAPLIPNTLNLRLGYPYPIRPDFIVTREEYNQWEELRFRHCRVSGIECLIVRPNTHENGAFHGPAYFEIMSTLWLRRTLGLKLGSPVMVEIYDNPRIR